MRLIPAIDLKRGKCVRLLRGNDAAETVYGEDPVAVAESWAKQGAEWLHIVNLDGAFGRASDNLRIVGQIVRAGKSKVEFGGGLRTEEDVENALELGVEKVVLGTIAFENREALARILQKHGARRVVIALDTKDGIVATKGWTESSGIHAVDAARDLESVGVKEILATDVARDGMLVGPDIAGIEAILRDTSLGVIASGGVGSLEHLRKLVRLQNPRLTGVIVGKALYERRFTLAEAFEALHSFTG